MPFCAVESLSRQDRFFRSGRAFRRYDPPISSLAVNSRLIDPDTLGHQILQAGAFGELQNRRETGARHEVRVVELGRGAMTHSHLPDALLKRSIDP